MLTHLGEVLRLGRPRLGRVGVEGDVRRPFVIAIDRPSARHDGPGAHGDARTGLRIVHIQRCGARRAGLITDVEDAVNGDGAARRRVGSGVDVADGAAAAGGRPDAAHRRKILDADGLVGAIDVDPIDAAVAPGVKRRITRVGQRGAVAVRRCVAVSGGLRKAQNCLHSDVVDVLCARGDRRHRCLPLTGLTAHETER